MLVRSLMYKNHQDYTTNRRKSVIRNLNVPPAYLKKELQRRGRKNSNQLRIISGKQQKLLERLYIKSVAATVQDRKKIIKACETAQKGNQTSKKI